MLRRGLPLFALTVAISCEGISALQARQYGSASSNATSPVFHHLSYHASKLDLLTQRLDSEY